MDFYFVYRIRLIEHVVSSTKYSFSIPIDIWGKDEQGKSLTSTNLKDDSISLRFGVGFFAS